MQSILPNSVKAITEPNVFCQCGIRCSELPGNCWRSSLSITCIQSLIDLFVPQQEKLSKSIHYLISKEEQVRTQISELDVMIRQTEVRSLWKHLRAVCSIYFTAYCKTGSCLFLSSRIYKNEHTNFDGQAMEYLGIDI